jgi:hypothetical protein
MALQTHDLIMVRRQAPFLHPPILQFGVALWTA